MPPFATLTSPAIPLLHDDIDTDFIAPTTPGRTPGERAFGRLRFAEDGARRAESLFNRAPFNRAAILIAGRNFGAGPHAQDAVDALLALGVMFVVANSFARPFAERAHAADLALGVIDADTATAVADAAIDGDAITVDRRHETIITAHGERYACANVAATARKGETADGHLLVAAVA